MLLHAVALPALSMMRLRSAGHDETDDPAALYGSSDVAAAGQPPWYSIDGYAYGVDDWRGNAVAENQLHRSPNDIPIGDVTPQTGNRNAVVIATTTVAAAATTTTTASRLTELPQSAVVCTF